jgi:hypothetical protein
MLYEPGQQLLVNAFSNASSTFELFEVVKVVGRVGCKGNRHTLQVVGDAARVFECDLNQYNHAVSRFSSAGAYDTAAMAYLASVLEKFRTVE